MKLQPGQRWQRVGDSFSVRGPDGTMNSILVVEIVSVDEGRFGWARGKVVQSKALSSYHNVGNIIDCGGFPESGGDNFWMYLVGQDAPC